MAEKENKELEIQDVNKEIDFALSFSPDARFRVNVYHQKGTFAADLRRIPMKIPDIHLSYISRYQNALSSERR